nr:replication protein A 70 kDa DNA-binding subunit B [Tanacetum cinerariifolium]
MFINRDLPEIQAFHQRFKELPEYDENQFKISVFTPQKPVVTIAEFFHRAVKKMVSSICECEQIHRIHKENGWAYTACKECNKKVNVVESKSSSSSGKNKVVVYCKDHGSVQVTSRYNVIMRIIEQSGSAPIVFFNTMINKLLGYIAKKLIERHGMDVDEYWPGELLDLVGKRFLFKIYFSDYNFNNNNHTYRCDAVNDDPEFIKHFKDRILRMILPPLQNKINVNHFTDDSINRVLKMPPPSIEIGASGSGLVSRSKVNNFTDNSLNHVLEMRTPSTEMGASRSASGSGRKRVFIDLDEIDSEDEVEVCNSLNIQNIVRVKVKKEDP